jgi:hypothetical protein
MELSFVVSPFLNTRGDIETYIIMNLEEVVKHIDKHMMTVQSIQYNPNMKAFLIEINRLAEILRICSETID